MVAVFIAVSCIKTTNLAEWNIGPYGVEKRIWHTDFHSIVYILCFILIKLNVLKHCVCACDDGICVLYNRVSFAKWKKHNAKTINFIKFNDWLSILMILMANDYQPNNRRKRWRTINTRKRLNKMPVQCVWKWLKLLEMPMEIIESTISNRCIHFSIKLMHSMSSVWGTVCVFFSISFLYLEIKMTEEKKTWNRNVKPVNFYKVGQSFIQNHFNGILSRFLFVK